MNRVPRKPHCHSLSRLEIRRYTSSSFHSDSLVSSLNRLVDMGHAGVQVTSASFGLKGAFQQLVRGTNEVFVNTVTSAPSSPKTSLEDITAVGNTTQSTNDSPEVPEPSDEAAADKTESDDVNHVDTQPVANGPRVDTVDRQQSGRRGVSFEAADPEDSDSGVHNVKSGDSSPEAEGIPLQSRKLASKPKFIRRDSKFPRELIAQLQTSSDDEEEKTGKSFRDVKKMGIDLVEEVREKSREVRAWTASKLPHLQR